MRTWQRRIEDGQVPHPGDASGRTLVPLHAVRSALVGQWDGEGLQTLLRADRGEATTQTDMRARFALAALQEAEHSKSGGLDEAGTHNDAQALMWITRAAQHGHAIARQQLDALLASMAP